MERARLSQARHKKLWTLEEAAERIGIDRATLIRWEKGTSSPQPINIRRICDAYGMTAEELGFIEPAAPPQVLVQSASAFPALTAFLRQDLTSCLIEVIANWPSGEYDRLQCKLLTKLEEYHMETNNERITRRDTLRRLVALPFATFGLSATSIPVPHAPDELLKQCASAITACWELSKSNSKRDIQIAFEGVSAYLPVLREIVKDSASYRKMAASLAAQCDLLKTILGWHRESIDRAMIYAREGVMYSKAADDLPLHIAILTQSSWLYYYARQDKKALEAVEQAASLLQSSACPLPVELKSSVQSALAIRRAKQGQQAQAMVSLHQFHESLSQERKQNRFVYVDQDLPSLILEDGMAYASLGLHEQALDSFAQIIDPKDLSIKLPVAERVRIEVLNNQVLSLLKSRKKDKELVIKLWLEAIQGAKALQSEQRYKEAVTAYDLIEIFWSDEKDIRELRAYMTHW